MGGPHAPTPGPWKADRAVVTAPDGSKVAEVFWPAVGHIGANARLIAAAPALLAYARRRAEAGDAEAAALVAAVESEGAP